MSQKKNPFKELEQSLLEVPPEMKQKVMNDIAAARLMLDIGTLVTYNFPAALEASLHKRRKKK